MRKWTYFRHGPSCDGSQANVWCRPHPVARPRDSASGYRQDIETKNVCSPPGRESSKAASTSPWLSIRAPQLQTIASSCRQPTPSSRLARALAPADRTAALFSQASKSACLAWAARSRMRPTSWSCSTAISAVFFPAKAQDVAQTHGESLELLTECNKLPVGLDVLCDLLRVFPAQSLSDRLSRFLPGVDPIGPRTTGFRLPLCGYLQILLGHRPWRGADGPHLFEGSRFSSKVRAVSMRSPSVVVYIQQY